MPQVDIETMSDRRTVATAALTPLMVICIRTARAYVQSVVGLMMAGSTGLDAGLLPHEFATRFKVAAALGLSVAAMTFLQNLGELLAKLDRKFPEIRA